MSLNLNINSVVLLAIVSAALAAFTYVAGFSIYTPIIIAAALVAGLTQYFATLSSNPTIPNTNIPIQTLAVFVATALTGAFSYIIAQPAITDAAVVAGIVIFLTTLIHEVDPAAAKVAVPLAK